MIGYIVKVVYTAKPGNESGGIRTYYIGKGGCSDPHYWWVKAWKSERWARDYVRNDSEWEKRHPDRFWDIEYTIMKVDARGELMIPREILSEVPVTM